MSSQAPASPELSAAQLPDQLSRAVGHTAVNEYRSPEAEFVPKTSEELLEVIRSTGVQRQIYPATLTYAQQPAFAQTVHSVLNGYMCDRHQAEFSADTEHAIAPPLPYQWVSSRLATYYSLVHKGDNDKVHQNTIKELRKQRLHYAVDMADALPEIATAIDIQALLDDKGHEVAADAIGDLLVVYGTTIFHLKEKQAKVRAEKQAAAQRAGRHAVAVELLQ